MVDIIMWNYLVDYIDLSIIPQSGHSHLLCHEEIDLEMAHKPPPGGSSGGPLKAWYFMLTVMEV